MKSVVAAVIKNNGSYLICRRPLHKRHGGLWEFPGGKVEEGESLLQAAARELKEELDLEVTAECGLLYSVLDDASGYTINFVAIEASGEPRLLEHMDYAWLTTNELRQLNLAPSDADFVAKLEGSVQ